MAEVIDYKDIIKRLRDDSEYYGEYGSQFLHNSDIYSLLNNPQSFRQREETTALLYGRAFHELVMFNEYNEPVAEASTRNTNVYKNMVSENGGGMLLLKKEYDDIVALRKKAFSNNMFQSTMDSVLSFEEPNVAELTDNKIMWACKADLITEKYVYDIKTTSSLTGFRKSSRNYNYDSQAYIYSTMFQKPMRFLVVEKGTGCVGLFDVSDDAYERGREKVIKAEEIYTQYYTNGDANVKDHYIHESI